MTTIPGADERRIRHILRARGVGVDAAPPPPTEQPRDWLDDILDSKPEEAKEPPPAAQPAPTKARKPKPSGKKKPKRPKNHERGAPRTAWDTRPPAPRQSLADAWDRIPPRLKWLGYHASAASAGWWLGWVAWATDTAAWLAAGHWTSGSAWVLYALAACAIALYRRTRARIWLIAWCAAVPVSSVVVGVLLYGTGYHS